MTRDDFVQRWKHECLGRVLDAAMSGRAGGELSLWLRRITKVIDDDLGRMWDAAQPQDTLDVQAEIMLTAWEKAPSETQLAIVAKCRKKFKPEGKP